MTFASLALISLVAMLGPILSVPQKFRMPVVMGELVVGLALGLTGFQVLKPSNATFSFLADIGFALVMFVAGTHVPVRDPALKTGAKVGIARAVGIGVIAAPLGVLLAHVFGTGHGPLYAVLIASSSASLVMPSLDGVPLTGKSIEQMLPQLALADAACIVALPFAIDPAHVKRASVGAALVIVAAVLLFFVFRWVEQRGYRKRMHEVSEERGLALELRVVLTALFAMAALAELTHVSIMLAGFSVGLAVAGVGEPRRVAKQVFALSDGLFGPIFFVWLGASLNLRDLASHPSAIWLGVALGGAAILAHGSMFLTKQPLPIALTTSAQLGVPVAAATTGTHLGVLKPGEDTAMLLGAIITIALTAVLSKALGAVASREASASTHSTAEPAAANSAAPSA